MEQNGKKEFSITELEGVRKVMRRQFELHEVRHLEISENGPPASEPVAPEAHQMADVCKCLHQAVFGYYEHIPSEAFLHEHLANDYFGVVPVDDAGVLEPVSPDDRIFRVNLRPFRYAVKGHDREGLFVLEKVVLQSSLIEKGSMEDFFEALRLFKELNSGDGIRAGEATYRFPLRTVDNFLSEFYRFVEICGALPLFSHSKTYHVLNKPAYVVADLTIIERSPLAHFLGQRDGRPTEK